MSGQPDQTVKQVTTEIKEVAAELPKVTLVAKEDIYAIEKVILQAFPGTQLAKDVSAFSGGVEKGLVNAESASAGITKLLSQFSFPLSVVGGMKLQGTGAIVAAVTTTEGKLLEGVRYAMTNRQKIVTEVSGWLTLLVTVVGAVLALFPQFGATALGGGVTIGLLIQALRNVIIPRLNQYSDTKA